MGDDGGNPDDETVLMMTSLTWEQWGEMSWSVLKEEPRDVFIDHMGGVQNDCKVCSLSDWKEGMSIN